MNMNSNWLAGKDVRDRGDGSDLVSLIALALILDEIKHLF